MTDLSSEREQFAQNYLSPNFTADARLIWKVVRDSI
jgi:hypothetical protein